jgi:predicted RNA binding protein YcfA (HicA-like mRNA interferase family)
LTQPIKKDLTFNELKTLLTSLGYQKIQGSGSRVKFYHQQHDSLINLHMPHSNNVLKEYLIRQIQEKLKELL